MTGKNVGRRAKIVFPYETLFNGDEKSRKSVANTVRPAGIMKIWTLCNGENDTTQPRWTMATATLSKTKAMSR